jgi:GDSL-like Lipase/Acylhydrolase
MMPTFSLFRRRPALPFALLGLAAMTTFTACEPSLDAAPTATAGSADFSRYISVGNSLTAGFEDNGLYREGQLNSYPSMLARQFALAGGGEFVQPLFPENQANGTGYLRLDGFDAAGSPILKSVSTNLAIRGTSPRGPLLTKYTGPINNLGVPGLRMSQIQATTLGNSSSSSGPYNSLFERIQPDGVTNQTYLARVSAARPTFFTCWLGNNDVLGYSTSGGATADLDPESYALTDTAVFRRRAYALIDSLSAHGAKGVVGLIPNVTAIPFFNAVGPNVKALLGSLNERELIITTGVFGVLPISPPTPRKTIQATDIKTSAGGRQLFTLTAGAYVPLIGKARGKYWLDFYNQIAPALAANGFPITFNDFKTTLQLDTTQRFGLSAANPWPSTLILDDEEQVNVQARTAYFNMVMRKKAESKNLAVFDAYTFFDQISRDGLATSAVTNTTGYITGNLFSLDGVHPSPRGYAVIANELLRIINAKYGSTLPQIDPAQYRGVKVP